MRFRATYRSAQSWALLTAALGVVALVAFGQMDVLSLLFIVIAVFVIAVHKDNIERLIKGTERKLGERARV